jgi:hypothetical protein
VTNIFPRLFLILNLFSLAIFNVLAFRDRVVSFLVPDRLVSNPDPSRSPFSTFRSRRDLCSVAAPRDIERRSNVGSRRRLSIVDIQHRLLDDGIRGRGSWIGRDHDSL